MVPPDAPPDRRPTGTPPYWRRGEQITWTYGLPGEPSWVYPVTVVRDDAALFATWLTVGTVGRVAIRADGRELRADPATIFTAPRKIIERPFFAHHTLRLHEPGRPWSVLVFFDAGTGAFVGWYCNIEDPHTRDARGTYSRDHVLDIWVEPDRSHFRKDEDELVLAVEQGRYTADEAAAITAVADDIDAVIEAWGPPFCDGWEHFRPDPAWPVPELPA
ncbi:DUF402 domain-containing protein [Nocardioides sp. MH1]|uniref:DUF402 domain-containing protein n=1 Tax=Nocardioides sp. MH1 TaxID=3242490 RepID=UPI00352148D5